MEDKFKKEVNAISGVHPDWGPLTSFKKGFIEGAKWQRKNMWKDIETEGYPSFDETTPIEEAPRYLVAYQKSNLPGIQVSYAISLLVSNRRFDKEYAWHLAIAWMPIPKLEKGE